MHNNPRPLFRQFVGQEIVPAGERASFGGSRTLPNRCYTRSFKALRSWAVICYPRCLTTGYRCVAASAGNP